MTLHSLATEAPARGVLAGFGLPEPYSGESYESREEARRTNADQTRPAATHIADGATSIGDQAGATSCSEMRLCGLLRIYSTRDVRRRSRITAVHAPAMASTR